MENNDDKIGFRVASFAYYLETAKPQRRNDSFSYLNNPVENFVFKVPATIQEPTSFSQEIQKEMNVYGGDEYFKRDFSQKKTRSFCSDDESRCWNSNQIPLMMPVPRSIKHKKPIGRKILAGFGCPGPCFNKKDIVVAYGRRTGSERVLLDRPSVFDEAMIMQCCKNDHLEDSRPSIDVFGSSVATLKEEEDEIAAKMERKLSILTWDAIPKDRQPLSKTGSSSTVCDEMASDASSDLFEIENITGTLHPLLTVSQESKDDYDQIWSPCRSICAPSEASIQWSVVTASAEDISSVLSHSSMAEDVIKNKIGEGLPDVGILRCKSKKAVKVAENAFLHIPNQDFHSLRRDKLYKDMYV